MTRGRERQTAPILSHGQTTSGQCGFNQAASHPADPIKRHRARRERSHPKAMLTTQTSAVALDLLENEIGATRPTTPRLESLVGIDAFTGALRRGILGSISAVPETKNTSECQEDVWLSNPDSNHSMHFICIHSNRPKTLTNRASRPLFRPSRRSLRLAFNGQ